ncbi:MAG: hypothetical protein J5662_00140 [Clostridia bacterium]|nr:hypothetical protein [Clostridia bacterium]
MTFSYKKTAAAIVIFTVILTALLILVAVRSDKPSVSTYILKGYNGTVALYKNEEIITVYDGIVLSTLPYADRQRFYEGITVSGPDDAQIIIEDYDG